MKRTTPVLTLLLVFSVLAAPCVAQVSHVIASADVLAIGIATQGAPEGKYTVDPDGEIAFPFIGRVKASGLTLEQLAADIQRRLGAGYYKDPRVTIRLEQARASRVFIFGAVTAPGTYQMTGNMTLIEALARAGYGAASQAVIVRSPDGATGPVLPPEPGDDAGSAQVIRVNLREFEKDVESGELSRNVVLQDGDTVYVPRTDGNRVFIAGEVRTPGAYSVPNGTSILEVIMLAGGITENAATGRIRLIRLVNGRRQSFRVELTDTVQPGDLVSVSEKFF